VSTQSKSANGAEHGRNRKRKRPVADQNASLISPEELELKRQARVCSVSRQCDARCLRDGMGANNKSLLHL